MSRRATGPSPAGEAGSSADGTSPAEMPAEPIVLRHPLVGDGAAMWRLARASGALEENSCYAYLLLATHFAETCLVAEREGELVGFVAAYVPPTRPDALFVWQIAVAVAARRSGLGRRLLERLVSLPRARSVRFLEATVALENRPSRRLFLSFAEAIGVSCVQAAGFAAEDFGGAAHEEEPLFRIGPLPERNGN